MPIISVVVPHLNEPGDLRRCLTALAAQRADGISFEVIVVDNGSRELPAEVCGEFEGVRLLSESAPGPGPARSRGAGVALAPILAFIDADCLAQPGWIRAIASYFEAEPAVAVVGGAIRVWRADPQRPTALELYDDFYSYRVQLYIERDHYPATGNMAVRKAAFEMVGPFGGIATMEDRVWGQRAHQMGLKLNYLPEAEVLTAACKSFSELTRRWDRHIGHEYMARPPRLGASAAWLATSVAVAASPLFEAMRLIFRGRGTSPVERLNALVVLTKIRLYRATKMLTVLGNDRSARMVNSWNRPSS